MSLNSTKFERIPERLPPVNTIGWVAWVKQNLFGSVSNTIITLLFFYLIFLVSNHMNVMIVKTK